MNNKQWDEIYINAAIATMEENAIPFGAIPNGALAIKEGKIAWVGSAKDLSAAPPQLAEQVHDVQGKWITPGLIDCHTHLVYAGNRYHEFEMRLQGSSYEEISKAGGGIRYTVKETRAVSHEELLQQSLPRARAILSEGVTTLEIKSGYGLDFATELKILNVAKKIEELLPVKVIKTFLGAHTLPVEYQGKADEYIDLVCNEMLPQLAQAKLIDAVDVFCETIGFNLAQTEKVFQKARDLSLPVRCHAEQLSDSGAAALAAKYQALSVDHLEFLSEKSVAALANNKTVAVLLPGAFYFLREKQKPPVALLRQHKIPLAIATDSNPGTSPFNSLLTILNLSAVLFQLTAEEALRGVTINAAKALGLEKTHGSLVTGKVADFIVWDIKDPKQLVYQVGGNVPTSVVRSKVL